MAGARRFGRRVGVRKRAALAAVAVVLVAMLVGGGALVYVLEDTLESAANAGAETRARDIAEVVSTIGITESKETIASGERFGQLVQIIAPNGWVEAASSARLTSEPLVAVRPAPGATRRSEINSVAGETGEWIVVARGVVTRGATYVVVVAVPIGVERAAVRSVAVYLVVITPLLLAATAVAVWLLFGWGLGAVERIRQEVAAIDPRTLGRRVQVPETRDELAALAETMNGMLMRLDRADVAQRAFVSDASHELRSPLATLTTAAELARAATEPRRSRLMDTIDLELVRIRGLVENLMILARVEAPNTQADADVDLDDLLDGQRRRLQATSSRTVTVDVEAVRVVGDVRRLDQVLRNLVDNAERHAATSIRLTLAAVDGMARIWVDNDGSVIDPDDRERIFDRFVRLDESRSRDDGGSGLGLAIAYATTAAHGGTLGVVDAPDGWCRFELALPLPPGSPPPAGRAAGGAASASSYHR